MRRLQCALLAAVAVVGFSSIASAADMPTKGPVYKAPIVAPLSWTGCYIGINGGGNWGKSSSTMNSASPLPGTRLSNDVSLSGGLIGGTLGCNYQVAPQWVVGIEGDWDWTNKKGTELLIAPLNPAYSNEVKENSIGTIRARLGRLVTNPWMLYVTGGGAWASVKQTEYLTANPGGALQTNSTTSTVWGWTVGVGTEYMFARQWSVKGEYLYVDLGTHTFLAPFPGGANAAPVDTRLRDHIVRVGLNYKFW